MVDEIFKRLLLVGGKPVKNSPHPRSDSTDNVRFTPESGPFSALAFMSGYDPKRTFGGLRDSVGGLILFRNVPRCQYEPCFRGNLINLDKGRDGEEKNNVNR